VGWLARPWFFAAVALLALNDHVFKAAWPGWVTGKLSDFAGLVVVGTLASVLIGRTWGTLVAGVGFIALKTVPGVAELVAPLLGGVTLRDPSDLIALAVLAAVWWALRSRPASASIRRGWSAIGLIAAVLATTATSQSPPHYVSLGSAAGAIYASVDPGDGFDDVYLISTDGGRNWATASSESLRSSSVDWDATYLEPEQARQVCAADGTCFRTSFDRTTYGTHVERSVEGSVWQLDGVLEHRPDFFDDLAIDTTAPDRVVALGPDRTVYYRYSAGNWVQVDLGPVAAPPQWQRSVIAALGSQGGVVGTFGLALVLSLLFAPWTVMKWALAVINAVVGGLIWLRAILATPVGIVKLTVTWLVFLAAVLALMQFTRWLDGRSPPRSEASPEPGRGE
jgi:hypothetical protein